MEESPQEQSVAGARRQFADLLYAAAAGHSTYITSRGRRIAAVVPLTVADATTPGRTEAPDPADLVGPEGEDRKRIEAALDGRGWTLNDFLIACMRLGAANPDAMLNRLKQFHPKPQVGRPPATRK